VTCRVGAHRTPHDFRAQIIAMGTEIAPKWAG
jgi:hypothetical protein